MCAHCSSDLVLRSEGKCWLAPEAKCGCHDKWCAGRGATTSWQHATERHTKAMCARYSLHPAECACQLAHDCSQVHAGRDLAGQLANLGAQIHKGDTLRCSTTCTAART